MFRIPSSAEIARRDSSDSSSDELPSPPHRAAQSSDVNQIQRGVSRMSAVRLMGLPSGRSSANVEAGLRGSSVLERLVNERQIPDSVIRELRGDTDSIEPLRRHMTVSDIIAAMDSEYDTKNRITVGGAFSGEVLENRIVAKAYITGLLQYLDECIQSKQNEGRYKDLRAGCKMQLLGHIIGRRDWQSVDSKCSASMIQCVVLSVKVPLKEIGNTNEMVRPFMVVDAGNNSELAFVDRRKYANLGYYTSGQVDANHLCMRKIGLSGRNMLAYEAYITSKDKMPNKDTFNSSCTDRVVKIEGDDEFNITSTVDPRAIVDQVLNEFYEARPNTDNALFRYVIDKVNQYREICDLPQVDERDQALLTSIAERHKSSTRSMEA